MRWRGTGMGEAVPHVIGRHSHPGIAPAAPVPAAPTGIDYLRMVADTHRQQQAASINFAALAGDRDEDAAGGGGQGRPGNSR